MADLDAFSASLVQFVRSMPDEALLELVRNQLGAEAPTGAAPSAAPAAPAAAPAAPRSSAKAPKAAPKKQPAGPKKGPKRTSAAKAELLDAVEKVVKSSRGLSASEVAAATKVQQGRVSSALRDLKFAKRIFQGGDRRFARYAGDPKTAETASANARASASGPQRKTAGRKR